MSKPVINVLVLIVCVYWQLERFIAILYFNIDQYLKTFFNAQDKNDKHKKDPHDGIGDDQHRETDKVRRQKDEGS